MFRHRRLRVVGWNPLSSAASLDDQEVRLRLVGHGQHVRRQVQVPGGLYQPPPRLKIDGKVAVLEVRADPAQVVGQPDAPGRLATFVGEEPPLAGLRLGRVFLRSQRIADSQPYSLKWRS